MGKIDYNKHLKEALEQKQNNYYDRVNNLIDYVNDNKDSIIVKQNIYFLVVVLTICCLWFAELEQQI